MKKNLKIPWSYVTKLYKLQFFLGYDDEELVGKMFVIDRFKINQEKFNNSLISQAITTSSYLFKYNM